MTHSTTPARPADPWSDAQPPCDVFPSATPFHALLSDLLGDALVLRDGYERSPGVPVIVDCLDSCSSIASARGEHPGQPMVCVVPAHDPAAILEALAQGAAGVITLGEPAATWRQCLRVVMGGGRWLAGPGLEVNLEAKHTSYGVARRDDHAGDVTMRTKLFVKQRFADKVRT